MENRIVFFMRCLSFPDDAISAISGAMKKISGSAEALDNFKKIVGRYDESEFCNYSEMISDMKVLSGKVGIHEFSGALILFLAMCDRLKARYHERGLSEEIFFNTISDLRYKNEECRLLFGINGTFVAEWFPGFFKLHRFALGRLQFETSPLGCECEYNGQRFTKDSKALYIHIPRTGTPLFHDEVLKSYQMASKFFAHEFESEPMLFTCHSWLLYPWNMTVLSPKSNLYAFCSDFKIVAEGTNPNHEDAWRLFDCRYTGNSQKLPRDSSLRRAYADRIEQGEPTGWGQGIFMMN